MFFFYSFFFSHITWEYQRSQRVGGTVDFSEQEWPLQGSNTLLRGGRTGCTISHTSVSFSSRSTTLSSRRRRATSRLVTVPVRKSARSFHLKERRGGWERISAVVDRWLSNTTLHTVLKKYSQTNSGLAWMMKAFCLLWTLSVKHPWSSLTRSKCQEVRAHTVLQSSHDDTWPVLTKLASGQGGKQLCEVYCTV